MNMWYRTSLWMLIATLPEELLPLAWEGRKEKIWPQYPCDAPTTGFWTKQIRWTLLNTFLIVYFTGTPCNPTPEIYYDRVKFKNYDAFLILVSKRVSHYYRLLAEKVKSFNKPFFFVRTHIDVDIGNERRKKDFDEKETLNIIRESCLQHLKGLITRDDVVLISNNEANRWDFDRLTQAIVNVLRPRQKESMILSSTIQTKIIIKEKVEILRGNYV